MDVKVRGFFMIAPSMFAEDYDIISLDTPSSIDALVKHVKGHGWMSITRLTEVEAVMLLLEAPLRSGIGCVVVEGSADPEKGSRQMTAAVKTAEAEILIPGLEVNSIWEGDATKILAAHMKKAEKRPLLRLRV